MMSKRVVLTGAAGYIASLMLPALRERYELTLLDTRSTNRDGEEVEGIVIADLLDRDRDAYRDHFRDADAVIHCALVRAERPEDNYWAQSANVNMAYNVYQTCVEQGVPRAVIISSCRATYYYEGLIRAGQLDFVTPAMKSRAESFYGWAKEAIEHLGFVFATGKIDGRPLENVQIRIGAPRETDIQNCEPGDMACVRRALATYLSARDLAQMVIKSIETEDIRDEFGVPFQVFYGVSGNTSRFWSIANARRIIGYEPQDDSLIRFADQVLTHIHASQK
ncbi:MAG: NAD(P)-dependent oxidoreductase, partial [Chloroflexota bacterium]|nr:NAD(P)-dependent oxidoreductase [Chloroflexota bacterium]